MSASPSANAALTDVSPVSKKERILFLDAIRGIALLGILLMNSMAQSQSHRFYDKMDLDQPITGLNFYAWVVEMGFFEGTMRGLFSLLFGAGTFLLLSRLEKTRGNIDAADIYYRRILWLLAFGLINAFIFMWPGDILYPYALCGLVLFPFRNLSAGKLLLIAMFLWVFGTYRESSVMFAGKATIANGRKAELLQSQHKKLSKEQTADLEKWKGFSAENSSTGYMKKAREETAEVKHADYPQLFAIIRGVNAELQSVFFYNSWWDPLMLFFTGMALFKSGFLTGDKAVWVYGLIALLGIGLGLTANYFILNLIYTSRFDWIKYIEAMPFDPYQLRRVIQTMGYLSLFILLYKITTFRKMLNIFIPVGQMAFTNYLSQSIMAAVIFYAFGWYGELQRYEVYGLVAAIWVFQIIFSTIWLKYFLFGPFEWLWRSLTYMKIQPFKK
ncbi:MAG: DUF418 domain-containing protein [Mucilaginibacter sp.]